MRSAITARRARASRRMWKARGVSSPTQAPGDRSRQDHRRSGGRRSGAVCGGVRQAPGRGCGQAAQFLGDRLIRNGSGCPPDAASRGEEDGPAPPRGMAAAPLGQGRGPCGPAATRTNGWAGSAPRAARRSPRRTGEPGRRSQAQGHYRHAAAPGHGRIEPGSGGAGQDLWPAPRSPRAAGPRFHRPGSDRARGGADRSGQDAVHRLQQVRLDPGARHPCRLLLRRGREGLGRGKAGEHFIAVTDPGLGPGADRPGRRLRPGLPRRSGDRRALLGALQLRHGPGGDHRPGRARPVSTRRGGWCAPARRACRRPPIRASSWASIRARRPRPDATR